MRTIYENNELAFPVKVESTTKGRYRVTYGQQVKHDLTYDQASKELVACIMHALGCEGAHDPE